MRLTAGMLRQIIKEEVTKVRRARLRENSWQDNRDQAQTSYDMAIDEMVMDARGLDDLGTDVLDVARSVVSMYASQNPELVESWFVVLGKDEEDVALDLAGRLSF